MRTAAKISRIVVEFDDGQSLVVTSPDVSEVAIANEQPLRYTEGGAYGYIPSLRRFVTIIAETDPRTDGSVEWAAAAPESDPSAASAAAKLEHVAE